MQVCARKLLQQHIYVYIYLLYIYKNWFHLSDLIITFWLYCVVNIQVSSRELLHWTRCLASKQTHTLTHTHTHAHTHTHTHTHTEQTHTLSLSLVLGGARVEADVHKHVYSFLIMFVQTWLEHTFQAPCTADAGWFCAAGSYSPSGKPHLYDLYLSLSCKYFCLRGFFWSCFYQYQYARHDIE